MGPLLFHPFFPLTPRHRSLWIIVLETAVCFFCRRLALFQSPPLPVGDIDLQVERFVVFEHTVKDPQDLMHADAHCGHIVFSMPLVFLVDFFDQRIALNGRLGYHI